MHYQSTEGKDLKFGDQAVQAMFSTLIDECTCLIVKYWN